MVLLFLDIRNFTPMIEGCFASDVVHLMKKLLARFQSIVRIHNGRIVETTGDGFYAVFGFDRSINDACDDAVKCGFTIMNSLEIKNEALFDTSIQKRLEVGIGVHAGKVATGHVNLGLERHMLVMGHAVNVASRLQSATKLLDNNFLISAEVQKQLSFTVTGLNVETRLKGLSTPIQIHAIGTSYLK